MVKLGVPIINFPAIIVIQKNNKLPSALSSDDSETLFAGANVHTVSFFPNELSMGGGIGR